MSIRRKLAYLHIVGIQFLNVREANPPSIVVWGSMVEKGDYIIHLSSFYFIMRIW